MSAVQPPHIRAVAVMAGSDKEERGGWIEAGLARAEGMVMAVDTAILAMQVDSGKLAAMVNRAPNSLTVTRSPAAVAAAAPSK